MKVGIGSYAFRWAIGTSRFQPTNPLRPIDLLHKAKALGADLVQYADNLPLDPLTDGELVDLAAASADLGIAIEVGTSGCREDRLLRYLDLAVRLGSPLVRLVLDAPDAHPTPAEAAAIVRRVVPAYRQFGVQIAIENHFLMSSPELIALIEAVDDPVVGVCLDTANSVGCQEWPLVTVQMLAPYAINLHLKDYVIQPDSQGVGVVISGAPLGEGRQAIAPIFEIVRRTGRAMTVILEQWLPQAETELETLRVEEEWVRQSVAAARRFIGGAQV